MTPAERFLAHLDDLTDGREPTVRPMEPSRSDLPPVSVLTYVDLLGPGDLTAFTYGLSLADHADWRHGKAELCISLRSTDLNWALAMGHLAESLRGKCPFTYGDVLPLGRISAESAMSDFLVMAPGFLDGKASQVDVGADRPIHIAGLHPIHQSERHYITTHGLEAFWHLDWDAYDPRRPPAA